MNPENNDWREEFDKEVAKLSNPYFEDNADGEVARFGYKTKRDNFIWTVTDFGNIKSFIAEVEKRAVERTLKGVEQKLKVYAVIAPEESRAATFTVKQFMSLLQPNNL